MTNMTKIQTDIQPQNQEQQKYVNSLRRLDRYAKTLDSKFRIPFTRIRFGLDPVIGLLPGIGDVAGLGLSMYLIGEAIKVGAGPKVLVRMLANVLVEFVVGLVPVLGDAFDVFWKANNRNVELLRAHMVNKLSPPRAGKRWFSYALVGLFSLLAISLLVFVYHSLFFQ